MAKRFRFLPFAHFRFRSPFFSSISIAPLILSYLAISSASCGAIYYAIFFSYFFSIFLFLFWDAERSGFCAAAGIESSISRKRSIGLLSGAGTQSSIWIASLGWVDGPPCKILGLVFLRFSLLPRADCWRKKSSRAIGAATAWSWFIANSKPIKSSLRRQQVRGSI